MSDRHDEIFDNLSITLVAAWDAIKSYNGSYRVQLLGGGAILREALAAADARRMIDGIMAGILATNCKDYDLVKDDLLMLWEMTLYIN